jgi:signal transduction histidine kinase/DNA-binding response OmpR family regulator
VLKPPFRPVDHARMSVTVPRVLLLEDDDAAALRIAEALSHSLPAAMVTRAATGVEYLEMLAARPVDVVVSDGSVPGCDEIEAFHHARRQDRGVSFVFLAPAGREPDRRALGALGISAVITADKLDELGPAVRRALSGGETVIDQARRLADPARLLAGQELLLAATRDLAGAADLLALRAIAVDTAGRLTSADGTTFAVREGDEGRYADPERTGTDPPGPLPGTPFPLAASLGDWACEHRRPAVIDDIGTDLRVPPELRDGTGHSAVVVPVPADQPIATLGTFWTQPHQPDAIEVRLLQALADSIAAALSGLRQRRQLEARAAARTSELAALTYAVSHDLRAPIRHLEGFARILLQDTADLAPETQHGAQRIQDAAAHLRDMVNGMLVLSRIAQADVHPQPVDLAQLGREVAQSLTNAPTPAGEPDRAGAVEFVAPEQLPVTGDPRLLLNVMQDLLGNAWKFTARIPRPRVELGVAPAEPGAADPVFFVRDNGAGFEPASAGRLFGVFQRLHSDEDFPGTGVGLAAVKRIVDKHGGTVRATGEPDQGATFYFTLPG